MRLPSDATKPLRVEVALNPATEAPAWRDVSALVKGSGVKITRGGGGRHEVSPAGRCSFTLDNRDGAYTDGSGLASSLYRKRVRVCYRTPGVAGNLLSANDASFESGTVGSWVAGGSVPPVLTNSAVRAQVGTKSMLITWGTGGSTPIAGVAVTTVIGRKYIASAYVWVPVGSPAVLLVIGGEGVFGTASTTFGAFQRISVTWTATTAAPTLQVWPSSAPTAGQQCWVDAVMVDEGTAVATFTTTAPPISCRFTGRIATNDLTFPALGLALTTLNATDELAWQGSTFSTLRSVPVQEILSDSPAGLWTLADGDLGDSSGMGGGALTLAGAGAVPTSGTAIAGTTTAAGMTFAAGQYLTAVLASPVGGVLSTGWTLEAAVRTTSAVEGFVATGAGGFGPVVVLSIDADGKPRARLWNVFTPGVYPANIVATVPVNDGQPHHLAVRYNQATNNLTLYVDGTANGTTTLGSTFYVVSTAVTVGGSTHTAGFTGLVAHVAMTDSPLAPARIADHATALLNGFNGESVATRVGRYNRWAGMPFGTPSVVSAVATVGHYDTEGKSIMDALGAVDIVEDGMTYVTGDGTLKVRGRGTFTSPTTAYTLPGPAAGQASQIRGSITFSTDPRIVVNDVTGTAPAGLTTRAIDSTSIAEYGRSALTVDGPFISVAAMEAVVDWRVATEATPSPQVDELSVRLSMLDDAATTSLLAVDLGSVVAWTDMPTQAPASSGSGVVLGLDETYTTSDLLWTATVSPNYGARVAIADSPTLGLADAGLLAAY